MSQLFSVLFCLVFLIPYTTTALYFTKYIWLNWFDIKLYSWLQTECFILQNASCLIVYIVYSGICQLLCISGDITKFSIMPRYQSITKQFTCHLRHKPPKYFYQLSYEVTIPNMQFSLGTRYKDVLYRNFSDLQNGTDSVDFVRMTHHTGLNTLFQNLV